MKRVVFLSVCTDCFTLLFAQPGDSGDLSQGRASLFYKWAGSGLTPATEFLSAYSF